VTEIDSDVELFHPAGRVWHALTDRGLLGKWFVEAAPNRLLLRTAGLPGYDADLDLEVTEARPLERLVLVGREGDRRVTLALTLTPTATGCRLSVRESVTPDDTDADRRAARAEQQQQALGVRLPAILDWLAFQQVDLRRTDAELTRELPVVARRARPGRRWALLGAGLLCLAVIAGVAVWLSRPTPRAPDPLPQGAPLVQPSARTPTPPPSPTRTTAAARGSATPDPTPSPTRSRTPRPSPTPTAKLTAGYETLSDRVFGYRSRVVVENGGGAVSPRWTVTVTVGDGAVVSNVNGAEWTQDGRVVTFVGAALPAGASTTIRFDVRDPDPLHSKPEGCAIDRTPCTGL
jgi:uncharacterized protein YndB with AHSA1/START domain